MSEGAAPAPWQGVAAVGSVDAAGGGSLGLPPQAVAGKQGGRAGPGSSSGSSSTSSKARPDVDLAKVNPQFHVTRFHRELMIEQIMATLHKSRPNAPVNIVQQIPALARRIEGTLLLQASSPQEYANRFTLESRMKEIAVHSVAVRSKRQRQTPRNSSCDLVKLEADHRKRAMFRRRSNSSDVSPAASMDELRAADSEDKDPAPERSSPPQQLLHMQHQQLPGIVACVSVGGGGGEKKVAFNFSRAASAAHFHSAQGQGQPQELEMDISDLSDEEPGDEDEGRDEDEDEDEFCSDSYSDEDEDELAVFSRDVAVRPNSSDGVGHGLGAGLGGSRLSALYRLLAALIDADAHDSAEGQARLVMDLHDCLSLLLREGGSRRRATEAVAHGLLNLAQLRREDPGGESPMLGDEVEARVVEAVMERDAMAEGPSPPPQQPQQQQAQQGEEAGEQDPPRLLPESRLLQLCVEHFGSATPVDLDLLRAVMSLLQQPWLEQEPAADRRVLSWAVDRLVAADPQRAAPVAVRRLLLRWPLANSERQVTYLVQLESVLRSSDDDTIRALLPGVLRRAAHCTRHPNCHVASCAASLCEKLADFTQSSLAADAASRLALQAAAQQFARAAVEHWHDHVRGRVARLLGKAQAMLDALAICV